MVGRFSEVFLSIFYDIRMETVHDNNGTYSEVVQGIDCYKTNTYQELSIYTYI